MNGRCTDWSVTVRDPHSKRRPIKLQDLELLLWHSWHVVVLGGVGASVGAGDEALGMWPPVGQSAVFWTGRRRRSHLALHDPPGCGRFDFFQLGHRGLDPAGGDVSVRAGGSVGVLVGGCVALRLHVHCAELWRSSGG